MVYYRESNTHFCAVNTPKKNAINLASKLNFLVFAESLRHPSQDKGENMVANADVIHP